MVRVNTDEERHLAKAVIVATGSTLKDLGVPGEAKLMGRGVSHCASCDGPLYNGQVVGVVGGGDSALQEALDPCELCRVGPDLSPRRKFFRPTFLSPTSFEPIQRYTSRYRTAVEEILGDDVVSGVRVRDVVNQ